MKKVILYAVTMAWVVLTAACTSDDNMMADTAGEQPDVKKAEKTVLVYMAGRNDLTDLLTLDLGEIKEGSRHIGDDCNLLVFVRNYDIDTPWLARIKNGEVTDSVSLNDMGVKSSDGQMRSSDPIVLESVMKYAFSHYPAQTGHYGLVLWGHASGWLMNDEVKVCRSRAFGKDFGIDEDNKVGLWLNIPSLANILKGMPHLKFIMADCCNFMCLENLYELRNTCDYIIGSPAEIPGEGAPYNLIVPDFFADGPFYTQIVDKYYNNANGLLPLTAVRTSEMENVAEATRQAMLAVKSDKGDGFADMTGLIHYYHTDKEIIYSDQKAIFRPEYNIFYDAGDFFLANAPQDVYQQWKAVLDRAILVKRNAQYWTTDKPWSFKYKDFIVTDEKMHGVSMFVPQEPNRGHYAKYNADIKQMSWSKVIQP